MTPQPVLNEQSEQYSLWRNLAGARKFNTHLKAFRHLGCEIQNTATGAGKGVEIQVWQVRKARESMNVESCKLESERHIIDRQS